MLLLSEQLIDDVRGMVWNSNIPWPELAANARLLPITVRRFAEGETKKPQLATVVRLVAALGRRVAFVPLESGRLALELDPAEYRERRPRS